MKNDEKPPHFRQLSFKFPAHFTTCESFKSLPTLHLSLNYEYVVCQNWQTRYFTIDHFAFKKIRPLSECNVFKSKALLNFFVDFNNAQKLRHFMIRANFQHASLTDQIEKNTNKLKSSTSLVFLDARQSPSTASLHIITSSYATLIVRIRFHVNPNRRLLQLAC